LSLILDNLVKITYIEFIGLPRRKNQAAAARHSDGGLAAMRFSTPEEYGLRCILQLAREHPTGSRTLSEMAQHESLTLAYVGKLMRILRRAGLVESIRGQKGGYQLARPADEISVGDVVNALGGGLYSDDFCDHHSGSGHSCVHLSDCSIRSVLAGVERLVQGVLAQCKLADLIRNEEAMVRWVEVHVEAPPPQSASSRRSLG
jgi:Rrf2 family protein